MYIADKHQADYIAVVEHTVMYGTLVVDSSINYIRKFAPASIKEAWEFVRSDIDCEYTNVYGVTNKVTVKELFRRV